MSVSVSVSGKAWKTLGKPREAWGSLGKPGGGWESLGKPGGAWGAWESLKKFGEAWRNPRGCCQAGASLGRPGSAWGRQGSLGKPGGFEGSLCGPGPEEALDHTFELRGGSPGVRGVQKKKIWGPRNGYRKHSQKSTPPSCPPQSVAGNDVMERLKQRLQFMSSETCLRAYARLHPLTQWQATPATKG